MPSAAVSSVDRLIAEIRQKVPSGGRIIFVSGNFNIIHPGHLRLLLFASDCGEFLVVGVNRDETPGVSVPADMRLASVKALSLVDYACLLPPAFDEFIAALKPHVIVKGKEYEDAYNVEKRLVDSYGGKLLFSSGEVRFSSIDLLEREYRETNFSTIIKPTDFPDRHGFSIGELKSCLARFKGLRVAVVGDLIVDEYIDCEPLGMSQEDPTIVVTPLTRKWFVGGAGIVSAHARGLGASVRYFTVVGSDATAEYAADKLKTYGVECTAVVDRSRPTTLKKRYRANGKTLLRVSELRQHSIPPEVAAQIADAVIAHLWECDLLVFADFNYGCLPQGLVNALSAAAKAANVPMVADSQASSQLSDVSRFRDTLLISPTEREARLAVRDGEAGLAVLAEKLQCKSGAQNVVITLGSEGMLVYAQQEPDEWLTDRLPALNSAPKDPAGAGDSFLTCAAMALTTNTSIWASCYLGALAAACQVSRVGNSPLSPEELIREIEWPGSK